MIPTAWNNLAGTMLEQVAHLSMHLAGERCPVAEPIKHHPAVRLHDGNDDGLLMRRRAKECRPEGISDLIWASYTSPAADEARKVLKRAKHDLSTGEVAEEAQISPSYAGRVLNALERMGEALQVGKRGNGSSMLWRAAK